MGVDVEATFWLLRSRRPIDLTPRHPRPGADPEVTLFNDLQRLMIWLLATAAVVAVVYAVFAIILWLRRRRDGPRCSRVRLLLNSLAPDVGVRRSPTITENRRLSSSCSIGIPSLRIEYRTCSSRARSN